MEFRKNVSSKNASNEKHKNFLAWKYDIRQHCGET